jgi:Zn-dependent metalloprotease
MKNLFLFVGLSILSFSCQKHESFSYAEWKSGDDISQQQVLLAQAQIKESKSATYKNKTIQFSRQAFQGHPIEGSFVKSISNGEKVEMIQAQLVDSDLVKDKTKTLGSKKMDFSSILKKYDSSYSKVEILSAEEVIQVTGGLAKNLFKVSFFDRIGTPYIAFVDLRGEVKEVKRAGSHFADVLTQLYTDGPKVSALADITLKSVSAQPSLSNTLVFVGSESDKKINQISSVLKFEPEDDRFDQVQVFYYLNKSFNWMKDHLSVNLPTRIDAVVHMGFPEKTNSAFYFQNKIRLGAGDDVVYTKIPQDASIVYHESFHAMIDQVARLPFEGEGGSLNEAFSDFFTALLINRPYLGESSYLKGPYKRTLVNSKRLADQTGGLYGDSLIFSGTLWEIKEKIGFDKAKNLAVETLIRLNSVSKFTDFNKQILVAAATNLNSEDQAAVKAILKARGFDNE